MIGVLMISHGKMAAGVRDSVELIMGEQEQFDTLGLYEGVDFEEFKQTVFMKIKELEQGDGVAVLVDLFGASPYNATAMNMTKLLEENCQIRLLTGLNLPMVLELLTQRLGTVTIDSIYPAILDSGREGIKEMMEEIQE